MATYLSHDWGRDSGSLRKFDTIVDATPATLDLGTTTRSGFWKPGRSDQGLGMTRRRALLVGGVVVVFARRRASGFPVVAPHRLELRHPCTRCWPTTPQFAEQMKSSTAPDKAGAVAPGEYREWASTVKDCRADFRPRLSGRRRPRQISRGGWPTWCRATAQKPDDPAAALNMRIWGSSTGIRSSTGWITPACRRGSRAELSPVVDWSQASGFCACLGRWAAMGFEHVFDSGG